MTPSTPFRLSAKGALITMISAAFSGQGLAATAGHVEFAVGNVTAKGSDGRERTVTKGAELQSGDNIVTNGGRAQIRFTDGAFVSLQPNTEFGIQEYFYDGKTDGSEKGFFSLVKGALRTVTGLVGRVNRSAYKIQTPTATVGIRGTGGIIQIGAGNATLVYGTSGTWTLTNPSGTVDVLPGTTGVATSDGTKPPQQGGQQPVTPPASTQQQSNYSSSEDRTTNGSSSVLGSGGNALQSATLVDARFGLQITPCGSFTIGNIGAIAPSASYATSAVLDGNALTSFTTVSSSYTSKIELSGTHTDLGGDDIVSIGRLIGTLKKEETYTYGGSTSTSTTTYTFGPNQGAHYVVGPATVVMPTTGAFYYDLLAATSPTLRSGNAAPGVVNNAQLIVDFGSSSVNVGMNLTVNGNAYNLNASSSIFGSTFSGSGSTTGGIGCSSSCSTSIQGGFMGVDAARAGVSYKIQLPSDAIGGAAAFKKGAVYND